MTIHQFNTLKWIYSEGRITDKQLRKCHQGNIGSLAKNKWIERGGYSTRVTENGIREMEKYKYRLQRKVESDVTDRVRRLLHLGKLLQMRKAA